MPQRIKYKSLTLDVVQFIYFDSKLTSSEMY